MASASLDVVLFVVSASPPHKQEGVGASPEQRYGMVEAALSGEADLEPCDIEMRREGPSYTAITLSELRTQYPSSEMYLIVGLDSLADIPNWREPEAISRMARILAVSRPGESREVSSSLEGKYDLVPFEESEVSSTEIRRRIGAGETLDGLVPGEVIAIIEEGGIYG
jgi:nicotinate-nucleotide adenylyltransferase